MFNVSSLNSLNVGVNRSQLVTYNSEVQLTSTYEGI